VLEQTFFCAIPTLLRSKYAEKMHELLNENGRIIGVMFNKNFEKKGPPFGGSIAEYQFIFKKYFEIGEIKIKVLHTPGHTLESSTFLLIDENGKETAIFSGDTLFLGDVGRPDLAQKVNEITQEDLAGMLYDSLQTKIMPLADEIIVYPAHGAGSACGKNMQKETVDTLGNQKKTNYALNQPNKESFIKEVLDGLSAPPKYLGMNVAMNKGGY
jgi:glyoxylase-like metal-dependent hydrolase (beta-lactamase superfamily II)